MLTIIPQGLRKIFGLFHSNRESSFHVREITRRTRLNQNSTVRFLKKLEKEKILISKKDGNLKKYTLKKSYPAYEVLSTMDTEMFRKLPVIKQQAIEIFLDSLPKQPIIVVLFGSTARQTHKDDSDIDILLIVNQRIDTKSAIRKADAQYAQKISDFQITFSHFKKEVKLKEEHVVQSAIHTGYPITNHIYYYRCIYNERI
jgi:predicted nucleotidyltransferase